MLEPEMTGVSDGVGSSPEFSVNNSASLSVENPGPLTLRLDWLPV